MFMMSTTLALSAKPFAFQLPFLTVGPGAANEVGFQLQRLRARRALFIIDPGLHELGVDEPLIAGSLRASVETGRFVAPPGEPREETVVAAAAHARADRSEAVVGLGGGSTLDLAKACALLVSNGGALSDYASPPAGAGRTPIHPLLPVVAIPTTAGTGSEVTTVSVIELSGSGIKTGISHWALRPQVALIDPLLQLGTPRAVTAASGIDALCHALEAYTSLAHAVRSDSPQERRPPFQGAHLLTDTWAERALVLIGRSFVRSVEEGDNLGARTDMCIAATLAGLAFGHAGTHVPHACAYPIAAHAPIAVPHGFAVAVTSEATYRLLSRDITAKARYATALLTGGRPNDNHQGALADTFKSIASAAGVPTALKELGLQADSIPDLVSETLRQHRLLSNAPRSIAAEDIERILLDSL